MVSISCLCAGLNGGGVCAAGLCQSGGVVWSVPWFVRCVVCEYCCRVVCCLAAVACGVVWCVSVVFVWWGVLCLSSPASSTVLPLHGGGGWHGDGRVAV